MVKWIIVSLFVIIVAIFVIRIIMVMLKSEKDSNKPVEVKPEQASEPYKEFDAKDSAISTGSGSSNIVTDMSEHGKDEFNSSFYDNADNEFNDYRRHARKQTNYDPFPDGFDFEGERSDEYIPDSPEFSYIPRRQPPKKKPIKKELNDMPTELKVLMLSDIFDRKFFD